MNRAAAEGTPAVRVPKTTKKGITKPGLANRISVRLGAVVGWWKAQDARYHWKWRIANIVAAAVMVASVVTPVVLQLEANRGYQLSNATLDLVGNTNSKLTSKLTYDTKTKAYQFNKESIKEFNPLDQLKSQVGSPQQDDKDKALYSLDVAQDPKKGVTYYDTNSQLSFTLVPQFSARSGKLQQQRLVYPLGNNTQAVYTLKNNGLKEDIVVQKTTEDTMRFSYTLQLPKTLEARALDDNSGAIGIYSANPSLYSNMSYGSDADKALVEKARENSAKDTLVFGIPAPTITTSKGDDASKTSTRFELKGSTLTVVAEGLDGLKQPFSIDPSVVIPSASSFEQGNNEGNIDFGSGIARGALTGGTTAGWIDKNKSFPNTVTVAGGYGTYNGYMYVAATNGGSSVYAKLDTSGSITGSWLTTGTTFPDARTASAGFLYNGYIYVTGGLLAGVYQTSTYYAKLNAGGGMEPWQLATGTAYTSPRSKAAATAYNGYAYMSGGETSATTCVKTVWRAPLSPNGNVGNWVQEANDLPSVSGGLCNGRRDHRMTAYNNNMYVVGGTNGFAVGSVSYAPINSDGTLGTWVDTTSLSTCAASNCTTLGGGVQIYNGYLYTAGGSAGSGGSYQTTVSYAPILANGSIGAWVSTSPLIQTAYAPAFVAYNGYLYLAGGDNGGGTYRTTTNSAKINDAGVINSYAISANTIVGDGNGRAGAATVAVNGYIYVLGGSLWGGAGMSQTNTVLRGTIGSNGDVSGWTPMNAFATSRTMLAAVVYGGYMYVIGGDTQNPASAACHPTANRYCSDVQKVVINSDGSLGTWGPAGVGGGNSYYSATPRAALGAYAYGGYIYAFGGNHNTNANATGEVDYAQICDGISTAGGCSAGTANIGTVGTWNTTANMVLGSEVGRSNFGYAGWGKYIYAVSGRTDPTDPSPTISEKQVLVGTIAGNGTVSWANTTQDLPPGHLSFTGAAVNNGYLYVTGGIDSTNEAATTYYSRIDSSNGTLGAWQQLSSFSTGRYSQGTVAYNGYLYVIGGCSNGGLNGYPLGCVNPASSLEDVQYAQINNGGSGATGPFTEGTTAGPTNGLYWNGAAAYNGYIYSVGGCTGSPLTGTRFQCGIGNYSNKTMQLFTSGTNVDTGAASGNGDFTGARFGLTSVAYNGYLYAIGGCTGTTGTSSSNNICSSGNFKSDVQYTSIASNGSLGTWQTTNSFSTGRYGHASAIYNGYLYVIGGCSAGGSGGCSALENTVQYALICTGSNNGIDGCGATAGAVGTWHAGTSFTTPRMYFGATAYNGYLYIVGGCTGLSSGTCSGLANDVQSVALSSVDGSLGAWQTQAAFGQARGGLAAVSYNGYLYTVGGCVKINDNCGNAADNFGTVYSAPIGAGGLIGNWQSSPDVINIAGSPAMTSILGHGLVISGGNLMTIRGLKNGNAPINSLLYAPIYSIPRKATYSKLLSFAFNTSPRLISYNGSLTNGLSDITYRGSSSGTSWTGSVTSATGLTNARCPSPASNRYVQLMVTFDDTYRGIFPDDAGTVGNLTDLTYSYEFARAPSIRLKLGKILQENIGQTDLDICKLTI